MGGSTGLSKFAITCHLQALPNHLHYCRRWFEYRRLL